MLIEALDEVDKHTATKIIVVITGKGPLKAHYLSIIKLRNWANVSLKTCWLEAKAYANMVACADLGVSLHGSSSGVDLPMKIVDMFGCGVPVCALNFEALNELLVDGVNGRVFTDATELSAQLLFLLSGPGATHLETYRRHLLLHRGDWERNWETVLAPLLDSLAA